MMENSNDMVMPVAPMYGGGMNNGFGGDWAWIILLLLLGWGNNGWGNNGYANGGGLYPWMNQAEITTNGFANQANNMAIGNLQNSVTAGFGDVQTALCGGFAGVNAAISNGFAQAEIANNARQIADMQQMFGVQSALQNCCCENRAGLADVKYTIATENCADRAALSDGIRDLLAANTASTQKILDQMCADKIDAKNDEIAQLRQELLYARGQASQIAQNQQVIDGIYNRLDNCPVGTTPVYGRQPIFTCNNGCGCGNL